MESSGGEGHEGVWYEEGRCAGSCEVEETDMGKPPANPCISGKRGCKTGFLFFLF